MHVIEIISCDFPGSPLINGLLLQGSEVQSLVRELRSYMLCHVAWSKNRKQ